MELELDEAIEKLKAYLKCQKEQVEGIYEDCNNEKCDKCNLCYEKGNMSEHIKSVETVISEIEKQSNNQWISVNERKPEEFEDVLVALSGKIRGGTCDGEYRDDICVGYYGYNRWHNHTNLYDCKVNYWMPLPKPYKESEQE